MLRVTEVGTDNGRRALRLEGRIAGPWASVVEERCRELLAAGGNLRLDLAAVTYVDRRGATALRWLQESDVELDGCSQLIRELLFREEEG